MHHSTAAQTYHPRVPAPLVSDVSRNVKEIMLRKNSFLSPWVVRTGSVPPTHKRLAPYPSTSLSLFAWESNLDSAYKKFQMERRAALMESRVQASRQFVKKVDNTPKPSESLDYFGGVYTDGYERFVRKIFTPIDLLNKTSRTLAHSNLNLAAELESGNPLPSDLPASVLLRMERMEAGEEVLPSRFGTAFSPLEKINDLYGTYGLEDKPYKQYPVYRTKTTAEYYSVMNNNPTVGESPAFGYKVARTASSPNVWYGGAAYDMTQYRLAPNVKRTVPQRNAQHLTVDYRDSEGGRMPLSPYMYGTRSVLHPSDSRIMGSNFVMLNLRPSDPFMNKIDSTLAAARSIPRCLS